MFIQYRVRLVLIYMRVALFKIRLLRKWVLTARIGGGGANAAPTAPDPTRL